MERGESINPYWVEWVIQTGGGRPWEFMIWIQRKWKEFEPNHELRNARHAEFEKWLKST